MQWPAHQRPALNIRETPDITLPCVSTASCMDFISTLTPAQNPHLHPIITSKLSLLAGSHWYPVVMSTRPSFLFYCFVFLSSSRSHETSSVSSLSHPTPCSLEPVLLPFPHHLLWLTKLLKAQDPSPASHTRKEKKKTQRTLNWNSAAPTHTPSQRESCDSRHLDPAQDIEF